MSTSPLSPSSTNASPASSPLANTSTLLFGFLVSALSIFAVFMTFAIVWNRLVARRRAIDAILALAPPLDARQPLLRPRTWDVWSMPDKTLPSWMDLNPVAAEKCDDSPSSPQTEQTISFWRRQILNRVPPEISYLFCRPISSALIDADVVPPRPSHGSDIQVSLLISMPRAPQMARQAAEWDRRLPEIVFATTHVLYHNPDS